MNRNIIYLSLVTLSVAGCSAVNNKTAVGSFEYAKQKEQSALVIPEQLKQPDYKKDFAVTDDINHQGPIGEKVDVRAPSWFCR
jgi:outer membrane protein assembly factor BamC